MLGWSAENGNGHGSASPDPRSVLRPESDTENPASAQSPDGPWGRVNHTDAGAQNSTLNNGSLHHYRSERAMIGGQSRHGASFKKQSQILQKGKANKVNIEDNLALGSSRVAYNSMVDMMLLNNGNLQFDKVKKQMEIKKKIH